MIISPEVLRQDQVVPVDKTSAIEVPPETSALINHPFPKKAVIYELRPTMPLLEPPDPGPEPVYGSVSEKQWELWVANTEIRSEYIEKRNRANNFAAEKDLRGVPFS